MKNEKLGVRMEKDFMIPGQTFMLDPQRKKQLETVAKSISQKKNYEDGGYLVERGKQLLG